MNKAWRRSLEVVTSSGVACPPQVARAFLRRAAMRLDGEAFVALERVSGGASDTASCDALHPTLATWPGNLAEQAQLLEEVLVGDMLGRAMHPTSGRRPCGGPHGGQRRRTQLPSRRAA